MVRLIGIVTYVMMVVFIILLAIFGSPVFLYRGIKRIVRLATGHDDDAETGKNPAEHVDMDRLIGIVVYVIVVVFIIFMAIFGSPVILYHGIKRIVRLANGHK